MNLMLVLTKRLALGVAWRVALYVMEEENTTQEAHLVEKFRYTNANALKGKLNTNVTVIYLVQPSIISVKNKNEF